jgi:HEAT repeat protein
MSDMTETKTKTAARALAAAMLASLLATTPVTTAAAAQAMRAPRAPKAEARMQKDAARRARAADLAYRDAFAASQSAPQHRPPSGPAVPPRTPAVGPEEPEPPEPAEMADEDMENAFRTAAEAFQRAQELRDSGDLDEAADLFRRAYEMDPRFSQADAALYWQAYANLHLEELEQAREVLAELLKEFPSSQWVDDARKLQVDLAARLHNAEVLEQDVQESDDDEIKKAALMGLLHSNPERAVQIASEIVAPGSKSSPAVRRNALMVLAMSDSPTGRAALLRIAQGDPDVRMRRDALMSLGHGDKMDEATFAALRQVALTEKEPKLVEAAVFAISQRNDPRAKQLLLELIRNSQTPEVRRRAAMFLMHQEAGVTFDEISSLYDSIPDVGVRRSLIMAIRESKDPRASAKLLAIARNASENESVRRMAVLWVGEDRDKERAATNLISLYDGEKDTGLRRHVLMALGQTRTKSGLRKLIQVAKSDPDVQMRRQAVLWVSESKDPEAQQFLEDLVK